MARPTLETFSNPAAGANFTTTIPTGETWRIWGGGLRMVTDATVINRNAFFKVTMDTTPVFIAGLPSAIPASQDRRVPLYDQHVYLSSSEVVDGATYHPIGCRSVWLLPDMDIEFGFGSIQAGDQISEVVLLVESEPV
jgi:hypothetical protein